MASFSDPSCEPKNGVILTALLVSAATSATVRSICLAYGDVGGAEEANLNSVCAASWPVAHHIGMAASEIKRRFMASPVRVGRSVAEAWALAIVKTPGL